AREAPPATVASTPWRRWTAQAPVGVLPGEPAHPAGRRSEEWGDASHRISGWRREGLCIVRLSRASATTRTGNHFTRTNRSSQHNRYSLPGLWKIRRAAMNPIVFALRHPITMIMLVVALVGGGTLALTRMRVDIFPPINQPSIYVFANYGGYDPYQMEG